MTEKNDQLPAAGLVAVDWGTSNFRAYLLDGGGRTLDEVSGPQGLMSVKDGDFAGVLAAALNVWLKERPHLPVFMAGMVGARTGWQEAPYVECPTALGDLARQAVGVENPMGWNIHILPGLTCRHATGAGDVMRGEETQIAGLLLSDPQYEGLAILPGTHSKWAHIAEGRVLSFHTAMTGELFEVLRRHSILSLTTGAGKGDGDGNSGHEEEFRKGLEVGLAQPDRLLQHLFSVRTHGLLDGWENAANAAWLSGLLIGTELAPMRDDLENPAGQVSIISSSALAAPYGRALSCLGVSYSSLSAAEAFLAGIRQMAACGPSQG